FAGNALATHDIEQALFGTSLGVWLDRGLPAEEGHEHHLRAINKIRRLGGIRDDGPLPEVVTDVLAAQDLMREKIKGVGFCFMIATMLHSIATGNLLP